MCSDMAHTTPWLVWSRMHSVKLIYCKAQTDTCTQWREGCITNVRGYSMSSNGQIKESCDEWWMARWKVSSWSTNCCDVLLCTMLSGGWIKRKYEPRNKLLESYSWMNYHWRVKWGGQIIYMKSLKAKCLTIFNHLLSTSEWWTIKVERVNSVQFQYIFNMDNNRT